VGIPAAERNENLVYICYDNEIYGNTGGQRKSGTPAGASYRINVKPDGTDPADYFARQRRFKDDEIDLDVTRASCKERMRWLDVMAEQFPHAGAENPRVGGSLGLDTLRKTTTHSFPSSLRYMVRSVASAAHPDPSE
jgi:hypothetical protein